MTGTTRLGRRLHGWCDEMRRRHAGARDARSRDGEGKVLPTDHPTGSLVACSRAAWYVPRGISVGVETRKAKPPPHPPSKLVLSSRKAQRYLQYLGTVPYLPSTYATRYLSDSKPIL